MSAAVIITLPFCYFPSFYAQNGNPPARSLIVPGAILIGYLLFLGTAMRVKLAEPGTALRLVLEGKEAAYLWQRGDELLTVDPPAAQLDRGVYLVLAELAGQSVTR